MALIWNNFFLLLTTIGFITLLIFYVGDKLAFYADQLSIATGISGAFIGFVLIAMITSIPEMVSTFVAVSNNAYGLAAGGVFGSNAVNIAILSGILLIFHGRKIKISNASIFSFLSSLILLAFVGIVVSAFPISQIVPQKIYVGLVFLVLYFFIMKHAYDLSKNNLDEPIEIQNISKFNVCFMFMLLAVAIVILSWVLIIFCKQMSVVPVPIYGHPLGENFIGTLILALATSIPELATTFQIVRRGNTNMAIENISGSNIFNLLVLVISSFFTKSPFWSMLPVTSLYTIFIIFIISLLVCIAGLVNESKRNTAAIYITIIIIWLYSLILVF